MSEGGVEGVKQVIVTESVLGCIKQALASLNDGCGIIEIHCQQGDIVRIKRSDVFLPGKGVGK